MINFLAEVMDKEPTATWLLGVGVGLGVAAWLGVRWSRWLVVIFVPLAVFALIGLTSEIRDPYVGPAIFHEAGYPYVAGGWLCGAMPLIGCVLGWLANGGKRRGAIRDELSSGDGQRSLR